MAAPVGVAPETSLSQTIKPGEHIIFRSDQAADGPTLIAIGSLHGNEAAGATALQRVTDRLGPISSRLKGRVIFLAGNTRAIARGERYIDSDLNRHWTSKNIEMNKVGDGAGPRSEDREQAELLPLLTQLLGSAKDEVYALDLHSTSAAGVPFATVGDTMRNRQFAMRFPVTILLGIEEQLDGTMLEYLNNLGTVTLGFEGGEHYAESTVDTHEALVWLALVYSGAIAENDVPDLSQHRKVLAAATGNARIVEVRYRYAITPEQKFTMNPGFNNFDPIKKEQILANDLSGAIYANESGMILMPLYQKLGEDGFFVGREVAPFWIWLSGIVRRLKLAKLMPILPGVRRSASDAETLEVDTAIARFFPLQIFHLLGFRKRRWDGRSLRVSRRKFDTVSPFKRPAK